jgi:putative selenate reductase FAD-binding subunit
MTATTILAPSNLDELTQCRPIAGVAPEAAVRLVGGGTLEIPRWHAEGAPRYGIHLGALPELLVHGPDRCGAGRTLAQIATDPALPQLLRQIAGACATPTIRNLATLGGNLAACRPGCLAVALLALDATVTILRGDGRLAAVPVGEIVHNGFGSDSRCPDVLVEAGWRNPPAVSSSRRLTLQAGSGPVLATVAVAAHRRRERLHWAVAAGGTGVRPQRLPALERLLDAGAPAGKAQAAAGHHVIVRPSAGQSGDEDYLRHLVGVLVGRAVQDARTEETR